MSEQYRRPPTQKIASTNSIDKSRRFTPSSGSIVDPGRRYIFANLGVNQRLRERTSPREQRKMPTHGESVCVEIECIPVTTTHPVADPAHTPPTCTPRRNRAHNRPPLHKNSFNEWTMVSSRKNE